VGPRWRNADASMGLVGADLQRLVCRRLALWAAASASGLCGPRRLGHVLCLLFQPQRQGDARDSRGHQGCQAAILVQAYLRSSTRLARALVRAHQRGIQVHVILDANAQTHDPPSPAVALLLGAGVAVALDARHECAHDKVMILDGAIVMTGSYNWTVGAEKDNGEDLLGIWDPQQTKVYTENWRRHAHHNSPYWPRVPWRARLRAVWGSLTRRSPRRWDRDMGEDR
jgi:hypothetical protein